MISSLDVLHVGYGGTGGATRALVDIAKNHSVNFHPSIILLGYSINNAYISELKESGIPCFSIIKKSKLDLGFIIKLRDLIHSIRPKIIVFHTPIAYLWGRLPFILDKNIKVVFSVEQLACSAYGPLTSLLNLALSIRTDKIICVSDSVRDYLLKRHFPKDKLVVIKNGVYVKPLPERQLLRNDKCRIAMVARLESPKDYGTLLKAFRIVVDKGYLVFLDIVGGGILSNELVRLAKDLGIYERVNFMGERKDVRSILLNTDIFVLSTHNEGLSISLLEAMEAGCPVIATNIPSNSEVIKDKVNGLLVLENREDLLADAIVSFLDNPHIAIDLARNARRLVDSQFNIKNTLQDYERLFISAMGEK